MQSKIPHVRKKRVLVIVCMYTAAPCLRSALDLLRGPYPQRSTTFKIDAMSISQSRTHYQEKLLRERGVGSCWERRFTGEFAVF
ncbi:hypothetical protein EV356DRAFT_111064 [Viridothelium virens]|uniref:Uncharacterized protein n=1 Tax=Viridothelium virens TaxID=1048519 RepID=A0A6A6HQI5_VIRVR|nr:hypothetical protein EV356DRAFT_111064 [Viridothelium virens]